jgi:hypothetical protein
VGKKPPTLKKAENPVEKLVVRRDDTRAPTRPEHVVKLLIDGGVSAAVFAFF